MASTYNIFIKFMVIIDISRIEISGILQTIKRNTIIPTVKY